MNEVEIARLLRTVKALCPAQKFDEFTPDAWLDVLDDVPFDDARAALKPLARTCRFIGPADIAEEIRRQHSARPDTVSVDQATTVPDADPDDPAAYIAALRAGAHRAPALEQRRPVGELLSRAFQHVPSTGVPS